MKKIFVDVETSGLNPKQNAILEIGCIIETDHATEEFVIECSPFKNDVIDKKALKVNHISEDDLFKRMPPEDAYQSFISILSKHIDRYDRRDKFFFFAYNATFDYNFLREWFLKNNDKYFGSWFFYPAIDVAVLAAMYLKDERHRMPNFKLTTVAPVMGVEINMEKAHSALYDTKIMRSVYKKTTRGDI